MHITPSASVLHAISTLQTPPVAKPKAPPAPPQVTAARSAPPAAPKHGPGPAVAPQRPHPRGTFLDILV
jgi:hypothetical protein